MVKSHPTVHTAGLKYLYHYQRFNPDHLSTILLEQKIHCSDPSATNDPWDFKPWLDYRPILNNPESIERIFQAFRARAGPDVIADPARPMFEEQLRRDPKALQEFVERFSRGLAQELCKRRIYCLTPLSDSILMWSHYTRNHTGICLEFSVDNPLFRRARPVKYALIRRVVSANRTSGAFMMRSEFIARKAFCQKFLGASLGLWNVAALVI